MVLFQNKILYMPSMPPFARAERIADYAAACKPVSWREERICAADGTELALAVGEVRGWEEDEGGLDKEQPPSGKRKHVAIIYFQGNGSSLPPRLPSLSSVLTLLHKHQPPLAKYTLVALSYRGFWTSCGRPFEPGIFLDAAAALAYARRSFPPGTQIVLWGQSLGAGVAVAAAADAVVGSEGGGMVGDRIEIRGLVLETPFTSVRAMLVALYPQKWLPYRYLGPFLRNHWDSAAALRQMGSVDPLPPSADDIANPTAITSATITAGRPKILILQAGKDELVPAAHGFELETICRESGIEVRRMEIKGALHTEVMARERGRRAIVEFLREIANG